MQPVTGYYHIIIESMKSDLIIIYYVFSFVKSFLTLFLFDTGNHFYIICVSSPYNIGLYVKSLFDLHSIWISDDCHTCLWCSCHVVCTEVFYKQVLVPSWMCPNTWNLGWTLLWTVLSSSMHPTRCIFLGTQSRKPAQERKSRATTLNNITCNQSCMSDVLVVSDRCIDLCICQNDTAF